jgi:hypothetical protein
MRNGATVAVAAIHKIVDSAIEIEARTRSTKELFVPGDRWSAAVTSPLRSD